MLAIPFLKDRFTLFASRLVSRAPGLASGSTIVLRHSGERMHEVLERPDADGGLARIEFEGPARVYSFTFG